MYLDLFSQDSYMFINRKAIEIFGILPAVYISEVLNISKKAVKKNAFNPLTGYLRLDRDYIEERTTIKIKDQYDFDSKFSKIGIISISDVNIDEIAVDTELFVSLIVESDRNVLAEASKKFSRKLIAQKSVQVDKKANTKLGLQKYISFEDSDLVAAMIRWIDSCVDARTLTKVAVESFQNKIKSFSSVKSVQLELITYAAEKAYTVADWSINYYNSHCRSIPISSNGSGNNATHLKEQKIATELSDKAF